MWIAAAPAAYAAPCDPWAGEPAPLPGVADPDPMRARWAALRADELADRARARESSAPADAHELWQRILCLAPDREEAGQGALRTRPVRVHRPDVEIGAPEAADDTGAWPGLSSALRVASRPSFDPELVLRWRADARAELLAEIDELMGAAESRLRTARFDDALVGSREVRERLSEMRRADDLPPRWAQVFVLEATALVAMGREDEARASMAGALAADPDLSLDPSVTSRKVLHVLEAARDGGRQ